jgi:hypothetical protein
MNDATKAVAIILVLAMMVHPTQAAGRIMGTSRLHRWDDGNVGTSSFVIVGSSFVVFRRGGRSSSSSFILYNTLPRPLPPT